MVLLALAVSKNSEIARDEKKICDILEEHAEIGFEELNNLLSLSNPDEFHVELAMRITEFSKTKK